MDKFTDLVLSWSPHQILDDNLYKNQVEKIPESFETVDQYLGSYVFPLLEETRAELASAMEAVQTAPFAEVTSLRELKPGTLVYSVILDHWRNEISNRGTREPYRTLPGDFFLLCDLKPQSDSDVQRAGHVFTFACVRYVTEGDSTCTDSGFRLKTSKHVEVVRRHGKPFYLVYLTNLTTQRRIWSALAMRKNLKFIEKLLAAKNGLITQGMGDCELCPPKCSGELGEENLALFSKLNESQLEAVSTALSKAECKHKSSVELIWGPPGTGKTTTLSILLYILWKMKVRTVICAPTNVAITELASRVIALVRSSLKTESNKNTSSPCSLGDLLIFGNRDNLKVGSDVDDIFMDDRVERLTDCSIGWKNSVVSMLDFLDGCVSQFQIFVDNGKSKYKDTHRDETLHSHSKTLLEFVRDRFSRLATPLRNQMLTIITHLPRSMLHEQSLQVIEQLISLVDSIEVLLFESSMTSEKLEKIFLRQEMLDFEPLVDIKSKCLSTLRSLHAHADKLGLPNIGKSRTSTEEFCFRNASLIFCTTSSAFKIHSIDMKPLSVLVIDEAAQVKECESIIALQLPGVTHAILVGDEKQLPAMVKSRMCKVLGFGRSLFERLSSLGHSKHLLDVQYRMHPSISQFPNSNFYVNQIIDAPCVQSPRYERRYLQGRMFGPYSFINVREGKEESDISHSRRNMVEVALIVKLVKNLFEAWKGTNEKLSIGVISPYAAQVATVQHMLGQKYKSIERFMVNVKSIDGFQGCEEDIIIMSTVRSHGGGAIGFLASPQRTNVALTRARHCMWVLGNERALSRSDSIWEALIHDAKHRQCFFTANDDCEIREIIVKTFKELGQLEDLLSGESSLLKNSIWKVFFSQNFRKSFQIRIPSNVKKLAISLLLKLANGWRPKKINVDWTCRLSSYVVKQFKVDRYYIVCSIDIIEDSVYEQVLKVWDILPMNKTSQLLERLNRMSCTYTSVFIEHCNEKLFEGNLELPKSWSVCGDIIRYKDKNVIKSIDGTSGGAVESQGYAENPKVSESLHLMKFYSLSSGAVNRLLTDHEGGELRLPFEVTEEERKIIMFPESSFILGRSGTGKTTILTMKLLQKFQQYCIASRECIGESAETVLHQLFVTVSPKLCHAVQKHVSELKSVSCEYLSGKRNIIDMDDVDEMNEFKDIPDTFDGIQPEKYPLIITFRKFLMMLDGTLGNSYFQRFSDVRGSSGSSSVALGTFIRKNEVTYERFRYFYWPHFNAKLTKNLDPSRVFTEIMSHIKGGQHGGDSKQSRRDYVSLSGRRVSTLIAEQREVVYDIFESYEKMKLDRGEFDLADFVIDLHLRLNKENMLGDKIDFVYIDEVQDLSMRQLSLFKYICKNVDEGFVFSGDTAQTIAQGIDFRFEDIRSLFYNEFVMKSKKCDFQGRSKGLISDTFCLSQNFRTHTGVLRLAQSVVDILCHFFPQSIDELPPEMSHVYGEPPVVLEPGCDGNSILTIFGQSEIAGGNWTGFGADQVILVRDDSVRQEISKYIGHKALILTILECKGLEFQDVLLYNFFGSSPLNNEWRVVYDFLKQKDLLDASSPKSFPSFSQSKHNLVCSELKQLYVAITRTRQTLWIYENGEDLCKPMFDYWRRLELVKVRKIDTSIAKEMQSAASSSDEWKSQGIKLFWEKNYKMAMMCFRRAGDEMWEKRAKASQMRAGADTLRSSNPKEARALLREAAEIFDSINQVDFAAECFCDLGEYERAGRIYLEKCGSSELKKAGECFSLAGNHKLAAEVYAKGYFIDECLSSCFTGNHFDLGLQYIENWRQQAPPNSQNMTKFKEIEKVSQEYLEKCARAYFRAKDDASLMKFVRAFDNMDSKRHFLKSLDCLDALLSLEEEMGNFKEAAEITKRLGYIIREVNLLEKSQQYANASLLTLSYVFSNSLWVSESQGWPLKAFPQKHELLTNTISFSQKVSGTFHASVCLEAQLLSHEQVDLSNLVKCYRDSKIHKSHTAEILSVRKLLEAHFEMSPANYEWDHEPNNIVSLSFYERMSRGQVSGGTLVYVWDLLKLLIREILECLPSLARVGFTSTECTRFCFNYFGVRFTHNQSLIFILMNPKAAWLKDVNEDVILRTYRDIATLEARHFVSAARKYWDQELIYCGLKVLGLLKGLYEYSTVKPLSKYCQSMCLNYIFDISRFLINSKSLHVKKADVRRIYGFLQLSIKYIETVFPLDTRQSLSENMNMMYLRETELSQNILEEIITRNISGRNKLTFGQIGRIAMIILGSGPPKHGNYDRITERLYERSSWKSFIEKFKSLNSDREALCHEFYQALAETYNDANWRTGRDYISAHCFFYLVERLLILAPHSHGFFFATKSSFAEYLTSLPSDADPSVGLVMDRKSHATSIVEFVVDVSRECLLNRHGTAEWIEISGIDCKYYFPLLMLRLVVIMCVSCLNSKLSFDVILELLDEHDIRSLLPIEFCEAILRDRKNDTLSYVDVVAQAFKAIGDPLLFVTASLDSLKFVCHDAIAIDFSLFSRKIEIMETLFPKKTKA